MASFSQAHLKQYLIAIIGNFVLFSEGMQFGWASSAIPQLLRNDSYLAVTKDESKWISNSYIIGDVVGGFFSFLIFNNTSRKWSLYSSCLPILIAHFGMCFAKSAVVFCIFRFLGGVGRNMYLVAIPTYLGEISNPEVRGVLATATNIFMNFGIISVTAVTTYVSMRASAILGVVAAAAAMVFLYYLPESPYYLLMVSRTNDARKSLKILRQSEDVEDELYDLQIAVKRQLGESNTLIKKFYHLFTEKSNLKAAGIMVFLKSMQMLTGISVITMHCHTIFEKANGSISTEVSAFIYYGVTWATCFLSTSIIERFNRRTLLMVSCFSTSLVLAVQGGYFFAIMQDYDVNFLSWLPVMNLMFFSLAYRVGLGTVCYAICSEIFPVNVKIAGNVLTSVTFSIASLIANVIFDYTEDSFGIHTPFWIFSGIGAFGLIASIFLPETKGKTLEEIQQMLTSGKKRKENNIIC